MAAPHSPAEHAAAPATGTGRRLAIPRRTVPRRPGIASAHFIDRETSLPNRVALLTEVNFALGHFPYWVAILLVQSDPPDLEPGVTGDGAAQTALALADRLRHAVRPSDFVGRVGRFIVGAALWGWEQGDPADAVQQRVRNAFHDSLYLPCARHPPMVQLGLGVARPGQSATVALSNAWCAMRAAAPMRAGR